MNEFIVIRYWTRTISSAISIFAQNDGPRWSGLLLVEAFIELRCRNRDDQMSPASIKKIDPEISNYRGEPVKTGWSGGRVLENRGATFGRYASSKLSAGFSAGVWECPPAMTASVRQAADQIIFPVDGEATIIDSGGFTLKVGIGDGVFLPKGAEFKWTQSSASRALFISNTDNEDSKSGPKKPLLIPADKPLLDDFPLPPANTYLSELPRQKAWALGNDLALSIGMWESTPFRRKPVPFQRYEFMYIQQGSFLLAPEDGKVLRFGVGDLFFVDYGGDIAFSADEYVKKIYWSFYP